jgi:putative ABC transport system permease protein
VRQVDSELPVYDIITMDQRLANETAQARFNALLLSVFAVIALILAAVGVYGVMSYTANQRTHEIGIRMALGAQRGDIFRLLMGKGLALTVIGLGIGLAVAFSMTSIVSSMLYGVAATDPVVFLVASGLIGFAGVLAAFVPAQRALKLDPLDTLRDS